MRGTILGFNVSARGRIVGALVETASGHAQLNFAKQDTYVLARSMQVGSKVDVTGELEAGKGAHPVYRVTSRKIVALGRVSRLNYGRHGHVNGYHLDDGTFLHVEPGEAQLQALRVGEKVRATGLWREGADTVVLEVESIERAGRRREVGTVVKIR